MKNSIEFYKGAISVIKLDPAVGALLQEMLADMKEAIQENDEHRGNQLALVIANDVAMANYKSYSFAKSEDRIRYMDNACREWLIKRPHLQKTLGLRITTKDEKPWLEADPDYVEPAAED